MGKAERKVELHLTKEVKLRGGLTRKWVSQGVAGVPDRICFLPGGTVIFVEVKTHDGICSGQQIREQKKLDSLGVNVCTVFGKEGVDTMLEEEYDGT